MVVGVRSQRPFLFFDYLSMPGSTLSFGQRTITEAHDFDFEGGSVFRSVFIFVEKLNFWGEQEKINWGPGSGPG